MVIIEIKVKKCEECPYCQYGGESFGEDFYICKKGDFEVFDRNDIPNNCPFIKSTLEKL